MLNIVSYGLAVVALGFVITTVAMFFGYHVSGPKNETKTESDEVHVTDIKKYTVEEKRETRPSVKPSLANGIRETSKSVNSNFIIEKSLMFVSTDEVM